jgi:hypothetical protein
MTTAIEQWFQTQGYIINLHIMDCTAEGVVGNYLYSGRALGVSAAQDPVQHISRHLGSLLIRE